MTNDKIHIIARFGGKNLTPFPRTNGYTTQIRQIRTRNRKPNERCLSVSKNKHCPTSILKTVLRQRNSRQSH